MLRTVPGAPLTASTLAGILDRDPGLRVEWSSLEISPSGHVEVRGLTVRGRSALFDWLVELDQGRFRVDTKTLRRGVVRASEIRGEGLRCRARRLDAGAEENGAPDMPDLPTGDVRESAGWTKKESGG